jgi:hypothetical protein
MPLFEGRSKFKVGNRVTVVELSFPRHGQTGQVMRVWPVSHFPNAFGLLERDYSLSFDGGKTVDAAYPESGLERAK